MVFIDDYKRNIKAYLVRNLEEFSCNLKKWDSETKNAGEYNSLPRGKYMVVLEELGVSV